jgi:translation initiation factor IF-2
VIEGKVDKRRGVIATLLVQNGKLTAGSFVVIGRQYGRVRAMFSDTGKKIKEAGPSMPVEIMGLSEVPDAGEFFEVVPNEKEARQIAQQRQDEASRQAQRSVRRTISLEDFFKQQGVLGDSTLRVIVKADVQGSLEPIINSLKELGSDKVKIKILLEGTGNISESDVNLAVASDAIVIGFNVSVDPGAERLAEAEGIDVRNYNIIYKLIDDVEKALRGLLEPEYEDKYIGAAQVRAVFRIPKQGNIAGCYVQDGHITRNALARVVRHGQELHSSKISSLKRFTESVREVTTGFECGLGVEGFNDFEEGDIIEAFVKERVN